MKRILNQVFWDFFALLFLALLLLHSKDCIAYASKGLLIWYRNMVPALFPFMILAGFMVQSGFSVKLGHWLHPILGLFFHLPPQMLYVIFMGFLCGFPMGAKIITDMLNKKQLTLKQGEYLLGFCNNIGPLYLMGYVLPLFSYKNTGVFLGLMYLVPLLYGFFLQFFYFSFSSKINCGNDVKLTCAQKDLKLSQTDYAGCFHSSLTSAIEQITLLGGCMIFFNCLQIVPKLITEFFMPYKNTASLNLLHGILCSLTEIGGGLEKLSSCLSITSNSLFLLLALLTFGGLSCIAQTCFLIKNSGLKLSTYLVHKFFQSCLFLLLYFIFI